MKSLKELIDKTNDSALAFIVEDLFKTNSKEVKEGSKSVEYTESFNNMFLTFNYEVKFQEFWDEVDGEPLVQRVEIKNIKLVEATMSIGEQEYSILNLVK